jgi:hypothetical protein
VIGGSNFVTTEDYKGEVRDYQLGVGSIGGDYYEYYEKHTGTFDRSKFWGADLTYSVGNPSHLVE